MLYFLSALIGSLLTLTLNYAYNKSRKSSDIRNSLGQFPSRIDQEAFSTELMKSNDELNSKETDAVTGLPVRIAFDDRLEQAITQGKRYQSIVGLMSLNIDDFAHVNQLGQDIGDQLLSQISTRLKSTIRQVDSLCRYAGNNFLLLMPQLSQPETAAYVAQRIQECLLKPFSVEKHEVNITASMGIAIYPLDAENVEALIQHANTALRDAKEKGKNNYRFYRQETHALSEKELSISNLLRNDFDFSKHISVHYVPQVLTDTGEIMGIQVIPCLKHPTFGAVNWRSFKKIAENTGKTTEIIEKTIQMTLDQISVWKAENILPKWVSISVDQQQFENTHFVFQVAHMIEAEKSKDVTFVLEIADSPFQSKSNVMTKSLGLLSEAGVQFAIEIYALGHSALHKFPTIHLNYFKLTPALLQNALLHPANQNILAAMIELARSTQIDVIAEGVDTEEQKSILRQCGCIVMQGKIFDEITLSNNLEVTH